MSIGIEKSKEQIGALLNGASMMIDIVDEYRVDMISLKNSRSTQCKSCSTRESQRRRYENSK